MNTHRRRVLKNLSAWSFAASALRFFERNAESATFPKRLLFVYTNAGRDTESRSTGTGSTYALGKGLAPLQPFKNKVTILDGVSIPTHTGEEHPSGKSALLTGRGAHPSTHMASGISFDRYLANKLTNGVSFYTGTSSHNTEPGAIDLPVSWNAAGIVNAGYLQGSDAFVKRIFAGALPLPTGSPSQPASATDQNDAALYDYLMADVKRMQRYAPREQVDKLELHVQALTQLRASLPTGGGAGSTDPFTPAAGCDRAPVLTGTNSDTDRLSLAVAHALACGRSRIGVVRIGEEDPYHTYSHWRDSPGYRRELQSMDTLWAGHVARLLGHLDGIAEGSGTLLDNTLVIWGSECCGEFGVGVQYGSSKVPDENGLHGTTNMPFVLAGGFGGTIKTGERIIAGDQTNVELFRTIAQVLGTGAADFGAADLYHTPLNAILR